MFTAFVPMRDYQFKEIRHEDDMVRYTSEETFPSFSTHHGLNDSPSGLFSGLKPSKENTYP